MQIMPIISINPRIMQDNEKTVCSCVENNNGYTSVNFQSIASNMQPVNSQIKDINSALKNRGFSQDSIIFIINCCKPLVERFSDNILNIINDKVVNSKGQTVYRNKSISDIYEIFRNFTPKTFGFFNTLYDRKKSDGSFAFNTPKEFIALNNCRKDAQSVTDILLDAKTPDDRPRIMSIDLINKYCTYYRHNPKWPNLSEDGLNYILSIKNGDRLLNESELEKFADYRYYRLFKLYHDTKLFDYNKIDDMSTTSFNQPIDYTSKSEIVKIKLQQQDHPELAEEIELLTTCYGEYFDALLMAKAGYNLNEIKKFRQDKAELTNAKLELRTNNQDDRILKEKINNLEIATRTQKKDMYQRIKDLHN